MGEFFLAMLCIFAAYAVLLPLAAWIGVGLGLLPEVRGSRWWRRWRWRR